MACDPALEADFAASWERMIAFYDDFLKDAAWGWLARMRDLVVRLRDAGYNRTLRAGQSMTTFMVSRSRDHGLRPEQPSLALTPQRELITVVPNHFAGDRHFTISYGDLDPLLLELLDALEHIPVD